MDNANVNNAQRDARDANAEHKETKYLIKLVKISECTAVKRPCQKNICQRLNIQPLTLNLAPSGFLDIV